MLLTEITQSTLLKFATELSIQIQQALRDRGAHNTATISAHASHVLRIIPPETGNVGTKQMEEAAVIVIKFANKSQLTRAAVMRTVRDTIEDALKDNDVLGVDYKIIERASHGKVELFAA